MDCIGPIHIGLIGLFSSHRLSAVLDAVNWLGGESLLGLSLQPT